MRLRPFRTPIRGRFYAAFLLLSGPAIGEPSHALDRASIVALAGRDAPSVRIAERRVDEARAARVGAGALAPTNPELSFFIGPRWQPDRVNRTDYSVGLVWPIDVSGSRSRRIEVVDERTRVAEREAEVVTQQSIAEALDLWTSARAEAERLRIENARLALDRSVLRAAKVRKQAGAIADGEVALALALEAQGVARVAIADRAVYAANVRLRARVGLAVTESVDVVGALVPDEPRPLPELLTGLERQPKVVRAAAAARLAERDVSLQRRAGLPVPRFTYSTGKDPDIYAHVGLDIPLPIYQRNQANIAVAVARRGTSEVESSTTRALGEAELRATYAEYEGARDAYRALDAASPAVEDAEHLGVRGYELGQTSLFELAAARREAAAARAAQLEAAVTLARAKIALDVLTGAFR